MQPSTRISGSVSKFTSNSGIANADPPFQKPLRQYKPKFNPNRLAEIRSSFKIPLVNNLPKPPPETNSSEKTIKKVPVLKITICKRYNKPPAANTNQNKNTSADTEAADVICKTEIPDIKKEIDPDPQNDDKNFIPPKPVAFNIVSAKSERPIKYKNVYTPKTAYARKGDLSRDNSRNQTTAERIRYLYTKAQRDCHILRIRLKALRERHKQEKENIRKLETHLGDSYKDDREAFPNDAPENCTKRKRSGPSREEEDEDECERLLREVRRIKNDLSNPKYAAVLTSCETINIDTELNKLIEIDSPEQCIAKAEETIDETTMNSVEIVENSNSEIGNETSNLKRDHEEEIFFDT